MPQLDRASFIKEVQFGESTSNHAYSRGVKMLEAELDLDLDVCVSC